MFSRLSGSFCSLFSASIFSSLVRKNRSSSNVATMESPQVLESSSSQILRSAANPFRVLIGGGCYAGLAAAINLLERCDSVKDAPIPVDITIVDERDGYYHVIGSPLALSTKEYAQKAWVDYKHIKILQRPDVHFVHGSLRKVDCETKTATIQDSRTQSERIEKYDFFIGATGLRRVWPVVPQSLTREAYLEETGKHIDAVTSSSDPVLVVGGGAVGIEMAAELKTCQPNVKVILAHSREKLLSSEPLPDMVKDCALDLTRESGVEVLMSHRLVSSTPIKKDDGTEAYEVVFENGHKAVASVVIMAISKSIPSTDFLPKETLNEEGLVNVLPSLQLASTVTPNADTHFAVGDMIKWSGIKRCGGAMYEGKIAALNIHQLILQEVSEKEPKFTEISEFPPMIGLAVGKVAVSYGPEGMNSGKQVMQNFFEDDLGFRIVWDHLRLGGGTA